MTAEGVALIAVERRRQIEVEGYTAKHDARHADVLARAAACYAMPPAKRAVPMFDRNKVPVDWPWDASYWKPTPDDRVRELVKAGALIAAEIDRLLA